jgi:hypothetical protein
MLSVSTASALRAAGLDWTPRTLDFFAIPAPGFEDQVFVINNMTIMAEPISGRLAITFHGSVEWALDHLWAGEVVWIPREDQLREMLEERLAGEPEPALVFSTTQLGYRCDIRFRGQKHRFEEFNPAEAYAAALLHVLRLQK